MGAGKRLRRAGSCRRRSVVALLPASLLAVALLLMLPLSLLALGSCGSATDANEPNDELNSATALAPEKVVEGVIGSDDSDVFRCDAPGGKTVDSFVVTVRTEAPEDIELQVGASIPGVWEGITWPGWEAVTEGDRVQLEGSLRKGTVLMFLTGAEDTAYSIEIVWE